MNKVRFFCLMCLQVLTASIADAQPRSQPFRFEITAIDAKTHQPRSTFFLGERVSVRVSLTNQSRIARTIIQLPDTMLPLRLSSMLDYENDPDIIDSYIGGTGFSVLSGDAVLWGNRPARTMTIAPGQTVSRTISDVGEHFVGHPLQEGSHTLTAKYNSRLRATISFRIVIDEAKTIPLLEQLASAPVQNGDDTVQRWANASLSLVRQPSITGHVRDNQGRPLRGVSIDVTGTEKTNTETRNDGRYRISLLSAGGTYGITPKIYDHGPGEVRYAIEPASKTISNLNGKVTNVDFTVTRIRASKNVASEADRSKSHVRN